MPQQIVCQNGHRWDIDGETQVDLQRTYCMICAAPAKSVDEPRGESTVLSTLPAQNSQKLDSIVPIVPGYDVLRRLGTGGMGDVYLARQAITERLVAIKIPQQLHDPSSRARFRGEAEATARLQHPGIVQVYEVAESPTGLFLVMEYCAGGSLMDHLNGLPVPHQKAAKIMVQLAEAIHAAHRSGIIHRDLKPANILLSGTGELSGQGSDFDLAVWTLKVADFGLARQLDSRSDWTKTGAIMGTPSYMSPEQATGFTKAVDSRADTYSLGAILYELLTGRPPFRGSSVIETLDQVRNLEPVPPTRLQPAIPRNLETICLKCLQKDPAKRYSTAGELAEDLGRFLEGRPILARPATQLEHLEKWARRNPYVASLASLLAIAMSVLLIGGTIYHFQLSRQRDRAIANLSLAMRSVDRMLTQVADEDLANEPRVEKKRKALLEEALQLYQELLKIEGGNSAIKEQTGLASKRVGDIQRLLGRYSESLEAYQQAIGYLDPIRVVASTYRENAIALAECYNGIGEVHRLRSRPEEAVVAYRSATEVLEPMMSADDLEADARKELARAKYNLGIVYKDLNRLDESQTAYEQAIALMQGFGSNDTKQKWHLARSLLNLGVVHRLKKQVTLADESYREAIEHYENLTLSEPYRQEFQHELAVCLMNRANLHIRKSEPGSTSEPLLRSHAILMRLVADFPATPIYRADLANVGIALAGLAFTRRDWQEAERWLAESVMHNRGLLALDPKHIDYHARLGVALGNLGRVRLIHQERCSATAGLVGGIVCRAATTEDSRSVRESLEQGLQEVGLVLKSNPDQPEFQASFRQQCLDLAKVLGRQGEIDAALQRADWFAAESNSPSHAAIFLARFVDSTPAITRSAVRPRAVEYVEKLLNKPDANEARQKLLSDPAFTPLRSESRILKSLER